MFFFPNVSVRQYEAELIASKTLQVGIQAWKVNLVSRTRKGRVNTASRTKPTEECRSIRAVQRRARDLQEGRPDLSHTVKAKRPEAQ
jgi:hypothetical protein